MLPLAGESTSVDPVTAPHVHNCAEEDDEDAKSDRTNARLIKAKAEY